MSGHGSKSICSDARYCGSIQMSVRLQDERREGGNRLSCKYGQLISIGQAKSRCGGDIHGHVDYLTIGYCCRA